MTGIKGATANHAKKQTKNASQLRWNARIAGVENENRRMLVALVPFGLIMLTLVKEIVEAPVRPD